MKPFTLVAALLLGFIALMQGIRFALAWPISVNGMDVPVWASAAACLVLGWIAIMLWREGRR
jgi:hypothetical protein